MTDFTASGNMSLEEYEKLPQPKLKIISYYKRATLSMPSSFVKDFELALEGSEFITEVALEITKKKGYHKVHYQITVTGTKKQIDEWFEWMDKYDPR